MYPSERLTTQNRTNNVMRTKTTDSRVGKVEKLGLRWTIFDYEVLKLWALKIVRLECQS